MIARRPQIGISVSLEKPDPERPIFQNKPLQFIEEGTVLAVSAAGGLPVLLPDLKDESLAAVAVAGCDGLLLSGGADIAPESYGEEPLREEWRGDRQRDLYELSLLHAALESDTPVLGICRGHQLINIAFGGTLFQDITTQMAGALEHRNQEAYDALEHAVEILPGTVVAELVQTDTVNSVHHQAVRDLGAGLVVSARAPDGIVEALESEDRDRFLVGVQWHPEWRPEAAADPVLGAFVERCRRGAQNKTRS